MIDHTEPYDPPERSVPRSIHLGTRYRLRGPFLSLSYGLVWQKGLYAREICGYNPFSSSRGTSLSSYQLEWKERKKKLPKVLSEKENHGKHWLLFNPFSLRSCKVWKVIPKLTLTLTPAATATLIWFPHGESDCLSQPCNIQLLNLVVEININKMWHTQSA